jgi:hypothetical protein
VKNRKEKSLLSLVCVGNNLLFLGCGPAAGLARVRFRHSGLDAGVDGVCAVGIVAAGFGRRKFFRVRFCFCAGGIRWGDQRTAAAVREWRHGKKNVAINAVKRCLGERVLIESIFSGDSFERASNVRDTTRCQEAEAWLKGRDSE